MVNDNIWLVVSNMNFIFHFIYGTMLPIDELIFFKMVKCTNQVLFGGGSSLSKSKQGGAPIN